jgi:hypothetical protein
MQSKEILLSSCEAKHKLSLRVANDSLLFAATYFACEVEQKEAEEERSGRDGAVMVGLIALAAARSS